MTPAETRARAALEALRSGDPRPATHWMSSSAAAAVLGVGRRSLNTWVSRRVLESRPVRFDPRRHVNGRYDRTEISARSIAVFRDHVKPRPWQNTVRGEDLRMIHVRLTVTELETLRQYCQRHTLPRDRAVGQAIRALIEQETLPPEMRC